MKITPREKEIVKGLAMGLSSKQLSDELNISTHTVNTHRRNIIRKLGLPNSVAVIHYAFVKRIV